MSSTPPSPSNKYLIQADTPLDPPTLNSILESIHDRIAAYEAQIVDYQAAIDNLNNLGLQVLAENLSPQIQAARDDLEAFALQLTAAEDQVAALVASGLAATGVTLAEIAGLAATNAQAAFAELVGDLDTLGAALSAVAASLAAFKAGALTVVNANATAVAGDELFVTTTGGVRTITLPEDPAVGHNVTIWRYGTNIVAVDPGVETIGDLAEIMNIDIDKVKAKFKFDGNTWRVTGENFA
jgi:hypothetical protein